MCTPCADGLRVQNITTHPMGVVKGKEDKKLNRTTSLQKEEKIETKPAMDFKIFDD